jgi:hypothetical protein
LSQLLKLLHHLHHLSKLVDAGTAADRTSGACDSSCHLTSASSSATTGAGTLSL